MNATLLNSPGPVIPERRAADRYLAAQLSVARILADSDELNEALTRLLRTICEGMDWEVGAIWETNSPERSLRCVELWHRSNRGLDEYSAARKSASVQIGTGLLGLISASRQPAWVSDVSDRRPGIHNAPAAAVGLRCHFGLPIRLGNRIYGVMEFFSRSVRQPDYVLLQTMALAGSQIAQFISNRRSEDALHASREKYRLLFSHVSDAIIIYDQNTRQIEDANDAALDLYGFSRNDLLKRQIADLILDSAPSSAGLLQQKRKDGSVFPAEVSTGTFEWNGHVMGIRVVRDISGRKRIEEMERLRQNEKLQREFVATVSHEFRTPVAAIKGFAETLQRGGLEDTRNRLGFVKTIERHANRLSKLVEDILELSSLESGKRSISPENIYLARFVRRFTRSIAPLVKRRRLSIRIDIPAELKTLADKGQLLQVLQNLLSNAVKFSRARGRIVVSARKFSHMAVVTIRDSGHGVPPEELPHIFERFNHCRKDYKRIEGTGLGLSIAKQIIEAHGGRIWAENVKGGAAFHFTLPLSR